jgi:HK97 family phage major capsid protein
VRLFATFVRILAIMLAIAFDNFSNLPWYHGKPGRGRRSHARALNRFGYPLVAPSGAQEDGDGDGGAGVVTADDLVTKITSETDFTRKQDEAIKALQEAERMATAGRAADAKRVFDIARAAIDEAAEARQTLDAIKAFNKGLGKPQNNIPVVSGEREIYNPADNANQYRTDHKPMGWIQSLPAAVQPKWVREQMGDNQKSAAEAYKSAFGIFMQAPKRYRSDEAVVAWMEREHSDALRALEEGVDAEGGYFVPEDWRDEVIHDPGAPGALHRPRCTVIRTARDTGNLPTIDSPDSAASLGEEAAITGNETDPTFGQVAFTIFKFTNLVRVSVEMLEDEAHGLPAWITQIHREAFDRHEDNQIIVGDGTTEHQGLRTASVSDVVMANGTSIVAADVHELYWTLPSQFRRNAAVSTTSQLMHQLSGIGATAAGQHFVENLSQTPPDRWLGLPTLLFDGTGWDDASAIAVNEELGAIGDFRRYYLIDRVGLSIRRLNELYAGNDQVGFFARKRGDGRVGITNAFRILKAAAA